MKKFSLFLLCMLVVVMTGCGMEQSNKENLLNFNASGQEEVELIPNGMYTVVSVRETEGGNNARFIYTCNVVLEAENENRYYYSYYSRDMKDSKYLMIAKLVEDDIVEFREDYLYKK